MELWAPRLKLGTGRPHLGGAGVLLCAAFVSVGTTAMQLGGASVEL